MNTKNLLMKLTMISLFSMPAIEAAAGCRVLITEGGLSGTRTRFLEKTENALEEKGYTPVFERADADIVVTVDTMSSWLTQECDATILARIVAYDPSGRRLYFKQKDHCGYWFGGTIRTRMLKKILADFPAPSEICPN